MTIKQRRFRAAIKKGAKTINEARLIAGYSPKSKTVYQNRVKTHQLIDEALPKEEIIENDFVKAKTLALKVKDLTNFNRANEDLARIKGMFTDRSINKTEITHTPDEEMELKTLRRDINLSNRDCQTLPQSTLIKNSDGDKSSINIIIPTVNNKTATEPKLT